MRLSRVLQRLVRYFNPVARFLLATPLHSLMSSRLMLLRFSRRKTGRSYTTPVSYVRVGDSPLVPGGGGRGTSRAVRKPRYALAEFGMR